MSRAMTPVPRATLISIRWCCRMELPPRTIHYWAHDRRLIRCRSPGAKASTKTRARFRPPKPDSDRTKLRARINFFPVLQHFVLILLFPLVVFGGRNFVILVHLFQSGPLAFGSLTFLFEALPGSFGGRFCQIVCRSTPLLRTLSRRRARSWSGC